MVLLDEFKVQDHEIDKHNRAHESNYRRFLGFPHVNGVDVGLKVVNGSETPQLAIRVFVTAKKDPSLLSKEELIPKEVDGVLTDVIEGGPFVPEVDTTRYDTLHGGIQIQTETDLFDRRGTLGVPFVDRITNKNFLLTCAHVALSRDLVDLPADTKIMQNVKGDANNLAGFLRATTINRSSTASTTDAALIALFADRAADSNILGIGGVEGTKFTGTTTFALNDLVRKRGKTTELTTGTVTGITAAITMTYGPATIAFTDFITIKSTDTTTCFSLPGDSGAVIVNDDVRIGALLVAGNSPQPSAHITAACKIANVQAALNIDMYPVGTTFPNL